MESENKDLFTWGDLKNFANELPVEELKKEVIWVGEERGGKICSSERLPEDYGTDDYYLCPVSILKESAEEGEEIKVLYQKGTPMLYEDIDIVGNSENKVENGLFVKNEKPSIIFELVKQLREDDGLYLAYQANIAMAFKDEFNRSVDGIIIKDAQLHQIANNAAKNFLNEFIKQE
jgi:hypothetical protein